jgi:NADH-ubiquinone oxidoreductase chain 1
LRAIAQTISYELVLAFVLFLGALVLRTLEINFFVAFKNNFFFLLPHLFFLSFVRCVAETNRAPIDLAEGESELVSGFNVEYGGLKFALIFMAEYSNII